MKKLILSTWAFIFIAGAFAQTTLTYAKNGILPGISVTSHEFEYTAPGNDGANQIWDFSKIKIKSDNQINSTNATPKVSLAGVSNYNVVLTEKDKEFFFNTNSELLELKGYTAPDFSVVYSDPLVKMKYPFSYGDNFKDAFAGSALWQVTNTLTFQGEYSVTADAYGTLILPDHTYKNALRIKISSENIETSLCSSTLVKQTNYLWYVDGYHYPVIAMNHIFSQQTNMDAVITETAYYNPQQSSTPNNSIATSIEQTSTDFAINSYPNPFYDKVNYSYFLRKDTKVTIEFFDMSGKLNQFVLNNQTQTSGIHSGEIDAAALSLVPGVYYIRFTFDDKVIVHKVVKI